MKYDRLLDTLNLVMDEHLTSISATISSVLLKNNQDTPAYIYANETLKELLDNQRMRTALRNDEELLRLGEIRDKLVILSRDMFMAYKDGDISQNTITEFQNLSNVFIQRLRRIEQEFTREVSGVDALTGLRSQSVLVNDLAKELSACERRGDYLGIAMGKIDHYEQYKAKLPVRNLLDITVFLADILKKNMRLYDDAYKYKEDMFVLCLKHTDQLGAVSATERIVKMLDYAHDTPTGKVIQSLIDRKATMSFSISKLEVGADIRDLLSHLEEDIAENADHSGSTILEYEDVSPIEKFARGIDN